MGAHPRFARAFAYLKSLLDSKVADGHYEPENPEVPGEFYVNIGKTVIFISHRLSTTRIADRIIMLENGQIVVQGTHEELLGQDGKYAQMWKVQAGAYIAV